MRKNSYIQGFFISFFLLFNGILVEIFTEGKGVQMPPFPTNLIILVVFVGYVFLLHFFLKRDIRNWLSGIPATVTSIVTYSLLVILMGFIPQIDSTAPHWIKVSGLSHINRSWEFLFVSIYLITILGLVILRRFRKFNLKNIAFFLNHAGIFIVIAVASISSGDLQRLTLPLNKGQISNYAINSKNKLVKLPFSVQLDSFVIQYYTPQLILFNPRTKLILNKPGVDYSIEEGKNFYYGDFEIIIKKYLPDGIRKEGEFISKDTNDTEFAAFIEVKNKNKTISAWISSGNYKNPSMSYAISDDLAVSLSLPEEKKYISYVDLLSEKCGIKKNVKILVNFPVKYCGFNIYQQSFEKNYNTNETVSVLELVKDPWLPVIYIGLIMLLVGAILLFWLGKNT